MSAAVGTSPPRRRQTLLVGLLVIVLAWAGWYYYWPTKGNVATSQAKPTTPAAAADVNQLPVPEAVALSALEETGTLEEAGRNPFSFGVRPPPPPPPRPVVPPPAPVVAPPPQPAGPPKIALRLVGMVEVSRGKTMATLKDPVTNALFNGFEGDIVDGRYRIVKIGIQSVTLSYVDGSGQITIGFSG